VRRLAGYTQESLAEAIGASVGTVRAWEIGNRLPGPRFRQPLARVLGLSVHQVNGLFGIRTPAVLNGHRVPRWLNTYESLVLEVERLGEVEFIAVPGLLQTKRYAEAAERSTELPLTDDQLLASVERRLARQAVLYREPDPLQLVTVLAEGVLLDRVGGPAVMVEQLDHLAEMARRPNVELRILGPGRAPAAIGGFELLSRPGEADPFMICTFDVGGPRYHEDPWLVARFASRFDHLVDTALSPTETLSRIREIRESHR
jgi:transcriptional regulator with XRE-family HTH domain